MEFSRQIVNKFQRNVSDGKTAYERRKLKCYRKAALVPFGELVMFMPMEKPKDKGEVWNCGDIVLGLVDRSDEVVNGTTERMVKARTFLACLWGNEVMLLAKSIRSAVATESS